MSHSNVIAPVISSCGSCINKKVKEFNPPCCWCRANSQYKEDSNSGITMNDRKRIRERMPKR